MPADAGTVTRAREKPAAILFGGMFILGLIATHVLLGMTAGLGGLWVRDLLGR